MEELAKERLEATAGWIVFAGVVMIVAGIGFGVARMSGCQDVFAT